MVTKKGAKKQSTSDPETSQDSTNDAAKDSVTIDTTKSDYDQLCRELNMDTSTSESAWKSYEETKHRYTLEVNYRILQCRYIDKKDIKPKFHCL